MTLIQATQVIDIWIVLLSFSSYQLYLQLRSHDRSRYEEGLPKILQILTGIPALLLLAAFMFDPDLPHSQLSSTDVAGLVLFNLAGLLILWSHVSLGDCWSAELETKADHHLVTTGSYRWVRHPLYTCYVILTAGLFLLSGNWLVGAAMLLYFLTVAARIGKEEAMMVERLGRKYLAYQKITGRFLPKFVWRPAPAVATDGIGARAGTWGIDHSQERGR